MDIVIEEIQDALFLLVHSPVDNWVLDLVTSFHTVSHWEIIHNYVVVDFGKMYTVAGDALDAVGVGDVCIILPNSNVWILY